MKASLIFDFDRESEDFDHAVKAFDYYRALIDIFNMIKKGADSEDDKRHEILVEVMDTIVDILDVYEIDL